MAEQSTLLIAKPDAVRRGLTGEILRRVEAKGLRITELRMVRIERTTAEEHYGEHREKPFFGELVEFITSAPVVLAKLEGGERASGNDPRRLRHDHHGEPRARQ
jgi:nucleoside-diphosphate kinase